MDYLHELLRQKVESWRQAGYPCDEFPAIAEVLNYATDEGSHGELRYLRKAQF